MKVEVWKAKWRYTDPLTKRTQYHEDFCASDSEDKAMEKELIYRQLFEAGCGCKFTLISWRKYEEL